MCTGDFILFSTWCGEDLLKILPSRGRKYFHKIPVQYILLSFIHYLHLTLTQTLKSWNMYIYNIMDFESGDNNKNINNVTQKYDYFQLAKNMFHFWKNVFTNTLKNT